MSYSASTASVPFQSSPSLPLDEVRRASWLKTKYSDPVWYVTDTDDASNVVKIEFRYRLADGRCLTEADRLYATVKEYAWFVRDPRFSKIDTAYSHKASVYAQRTIAHALTLRNLWSYAHLQQGVIEELVQELRFGSDAVLHASERLAAHIQSIENNPEARIQRYRGFPLARTVEGFSKNMIDVGQLLASCNLPRSVIVLPRVAWLIADAARRNGMAPPSKRDRAETIPPLENVTKQVLHRSLDSLDLLYAVRHHAQCELPSFRPFPEGAIKVANLYGLDTKPTPVPPPKLVLHLLEASATWVGKYSEPILKCLDELEALGSAADGEEVQATLRRCQVALPATVRNRLMETERPERFVLNTVEMLATAAWVIIAAFGARRYEETVDLDEESLVGDNDDGWWLNSLISKTTRSRELIPVPLIVSRAVQTLLAISATARADGLEGIYCWLAPPAVRDRWSPREISPRRLLNSFSKLVSTPIYDDGTQSVDWHWIPRQFRRFFAVLYYYRHDGADLAILSYFLRHFDIETTRGYLTRDPVAAKIWRDVERDYVRRLADSIVSGEREVGGAMGERLKRIAKLVKDRLDKRLIVTKDLAGERLQTIMERGGLVLTPKPWTICTCPRSHNAAKKARCRAGQTLTEDIVGPSYADAGPTVCADCRWALLDETKSAYPLRAQEQLEASVGSGRGAGTLFGELEQAQVVELRRAADRLPRRRVGTSND